MARLFVCASITSRCLKSTHVHQHNLLIGSVVCISEVLSVCQRAFYDSAWHSRARCRATFRALLWARSRIAIRYRLVILAIAQRRRRACNSIAPTSLVMAENVIVGVKNGDSAFRKTARVDVVLHVKSLRACHHRRDSPAAKRVSRGVYNRACRSQLRRDCGTRKFRSFFCFVRVLW